MSAKKPKVIECDICGKDFEARPGGRPKTCPDCRAKRSQSPFKEVGEHGTSAVSGGRRPAVTVRRPL